MKSPAVEPEKVFEVLDRPSMATLIELVADLSLFVDRNGRIEEMSVGSEDLDSDLNRQWVGRNWSETVTDDSLAKIDEFLQLSRTADGRSLCRDINHVLADGSELPISYCAVSCGADGRVIAIGRDLRAVTALRQQLLNALLALERDYWKLRQMETCYRLLFQMTTDAVVVVDNSTGRVLEGNPSADELLGTEGASIVGKPFPLGLDTAGRSAVSALMSEVRAMGRGTLSNVRSADGDREFMVVVNLLRQDQDTRFLVRLSPARTERPPRITDRSFRLDDMLRRAPDAILVIDTDGRIRAANLTFVDQAQLATEEQAVGQSIERWLGRTSVDLSVLLRNLKRHGTVRLFSTTLRSEYGTIADVEISANRITDGDDVSFVIYVRDVSCRISAANPLTPNLPRSVDQITQQVGRVPLDHFVEQAAE